MRCLLLLFAVGCAAGPRELRVSAADHYCAPDHRDDLCVSGLERGLTLALRQALDGRDGRPDAAAIAGEVRLLRVDFDEGAVSITYELFADGLIAVRRDTVRARYAAGQRRQALLSALVGVVVAVRGLLTGVQTL